MLYICDIPMVGPLSESLIMWRIMDENVAMDGLGSLAQPTRLAIFRRLLAAYPGTLAAGEFARACDAPHNTMSTHLGILTRAGLVQVDASAAG